MVVEYYGNPNEACAEEIAFMTDYSVNLGKQTLSFSRLLVGDSVESIVFANGARFVRQPQEGGE